VRSAPAVAGVAALHYGALLEIEATAIVGRQVEECVVSLTIVSSRALGSNDWFGGRNDSQALWVNDTTLIFLPNHSS
jgi:hypothetical protein